MKKSRVIKYLFMDHIIPTYAHFITGEYFPYDERWNKISYIRYEERVKIYNSFEEDPRKLSKEEDEKLLITGWLNLDTGNWEPEEFEINE